MSERRPGGTYEDVLNAPEDRVAEIVEGDFYSSPRPAIRHARIKAILTAEIVDAFDRGRTGPGGWWILPEPEIHLLPDILVPDLAGWRRERLAHLPDAPAFTLVPDWVCEILSPSTWDLDRRKKFPAYAGHRVEWLWLVDPSARRLEVYRLDRDRWRHVTTHEGRGHACAEPFDAIEIELGALWPE
ncbi:MAG TPA: Uma2 family endonuclease [Thermoanaerobaculia bacterium]|nr:Uma2 family endonuclease [Thermoanaerobaculia bacterium]